MELNEISEKVIGGAIEVHQAIGPGLLESAYEACMRQELKLRGLAVEPQRVLPIEYKGLKLDCGYRIDLLVESQVVVELKAVHALEPVHEAQLLTYLKLGNWKLGLLINFNVPLLKHGIKRMMN